MNLFECVLKTSGGGNGADLIVTCDSAYAGAAITCSDGGSNTFTEVCPSTSPYTVTFESIPVGTYTISGVVSGQTVSTTKTILDFTANLNNIPNGATVTPVNDIQTWLHCANIWDKSYTTLNEVLADNTTLLALISSNNAVDYMARSTSWASSVCANQTAMGYIGNNNYCADALLTDSTWCTAICNSTYFESVLTTKVPTMTSNTAPSGVASASSVYASAFPAYKAFDGTNATWFPASGAGNNCWVQYQFPNAFKCRAVEFGFSALIFNSGDVSKIQGSNDGSTWSDLYTLTSDDKSSAQTSVVKKVLTNNTSYKYYRLLIGSMGTGGGNGVYKLQFYGRA